MFMSYNISSYTPSLDRNINDLRFHMKYVNSAYYNEREGRGEVLNVREAKGGVKTPRNWYFV